MPSKRESTCWMQPVFLANGPKNKVGHRGIVRKKPNSSPPAAQKNNGLQMTPLTFPQTPAANGVIGAGGAPGAISGPASPTSAPAAEVLACQAQSPPTKPVPVIQNTMPSTKAPEVPQQSGYTVSPTKPAAPSPVQAPPPATPKPPTPSVAAPATPKVAGPSKTQATAATPKTKDAVPKEAPKEKQAEAEEKPKSKKAGIVWMSLSSLTERPTASSTCWNKAGGVGKGTNFIQMYRHPDEIAQQKATYYQSSGSGGKGAAMHPNAAQTLNAWRMQQQQRQQQLQSLKPAPPPLSTTSSTTSSCSEATQSPHSANGTIDVVLDMSEIEQLELDESFLGTPFDDPDAPFSAETAQPLPTPKGEDASLWGAIADLFGVSTVDELGVEQKGSEKPKRRSERDSKSIYASMYGTRKRSKSSHAASEPSETAPESVSLEPLPLALEPIASSAGSSADGSLACDTCGDQLDDCMNALDDQLLSPDAEADRISAEQFLDWANDDVAAMAPLKVC